MVTVVRKEARICHCGWAIEACLAIRQATHKHEHERGSKSGRQVHGCSSPAPYCVSLRGSSGMVRQAAFAVECRFAVTTPMQLSKPALALTIWFKIFPSGTPKKSPQIRRPSQIKFSPPGNYH